MDVSHTMWRMMSADPSAKNAKLSRRTVRRVAGYARAYKGLLIGFLVSIVVSSLLGLAPPFLFKAIIDDAIPSRDSGRLTTLALLVIAAALGAAVLQLGERFCSTRIGEGLIYDLRTQLYDHVQRLPVSFFTHSQTGALVSRLNNDVIGAQRAFTGTLGTVVSNVITVVVTLGAMIGLDWRLTILSVLLLPLFLVPSKYIGQRLAGITREGMEHNAEMNNLMTERFGVSGALLVKTYGSEDSELHRFAGRAAKVRDIGVRSAMLTRTFMSIMGLVGAAGTAAVYWYGGLRVIDGSLTPGALIALAALVIRIYEPLTNLTNARVDVMSAFVSFDRVFEVLDTPNPLTDPPDPEPLRDVAGSVEFDHVTFRYPSAESSAARSLTGGVVTTADDDREVLHDVSLAIEPGQMMALVGPSGAGKSTIAALLGRLYDVTEGSVRIDGHDVRNVAQIDLRRALGVVAQDPHLFHATVRENLMYARPEASEAEMIEACNAARILSVIERLPESFDTVVGERGYRLSGGEKQRLAIARMLLKDPAIVVLDEATSHLDSENEALVQDALARALTGRTSVVIAHRLSTVVSADVIAVLDGGRIVDRGTHAELIARGGLYAELYRTLATQSA